MPNPERPKYNKIGWPKDEISNGIRDVKCYGIFYSREVDILEKKRKIYFDDFPTKGYNTTVADRGTVKAPCGHIFYFVYITRWHSCD